MTTLRPYQAAVLRALTDRPTHPFMLQRDPHDAGVFPALGQLPIVLHELERMGHAVFVHSDDHRGCGWVRALPLGDGYSARPFAPGFDPAVPSGWAV